MQVRLSAPSLTFHSHSILCVRQLLRSRTRRICQARLDEAYSSALALQEEAEHGPETKRWHVSGDATFVMCTGCGKATRTGPLCEVRRCPLTSLVNLA